MFDELKSCTVAKLKKICKNEGIQKYTKLKKKDLINTIIVERVSKAVKDGLDEFMNLSPN